jgi:molybdopterin-synthase adenylyltransferase
MAFSSSELARYGRQMRIEGWGEKGQAKLRASTVFVAGAGGLGSPVAMYLAVAGVGRIRIADADSPEMSNLNRQLLHDPSRIGMNKALSAKMTLDRINPDVEVLALTDVIAETNVDELVGDAQVIVDCLDNFPTRFALNGAALRKRIPLVHGAVWGMDGRVAFLYAPRTPCLRCFVPEPPPTHAVPVVGAAAGIVGSLQALEVIKYLTGTGSECAGSLFVWDGAEMRLAEQKLRRDPECPACRDAG